VLNTTTYNRSWILLRLTVFRTLGDKKQTSRHSSVLLRAESHLWLHTSRDRTGPAAAAAVKHHMCECYLRSCDDRDSTNNLSFVRDLFHGTKNILRSLCSLALSRLWHLEHNGRVTADTSDHHNLSRSQLSVKRRKETMSSSGTKLI